ncbi:hypothetical protein NDU88_005375 [Pleurodeles waltl]|uniref:Uncharacterized protein n=1 Tax=Pleurodeles waltl TaxID=8319 RepID=A0AAV7TC24_PLEWA|nr:hypothetical protein NDU88_005375 [Pleurodeles waltl]
MRNSDGRIPSYNSCRAQKENEAGVDHSTAVEESSEVEPGRSVHCDGVDETGGCRRRKASIAAPRVREGDMGKRETLSVPTGAKQSIDIRKETIETPDGRRSDKAIEEEASSLTLLKGSPEKPAPRRK